MPTADANSLVEVYESGVSFGGSTRKHVCVQDDSMEDVKGRSVHCGIGDSPTMLN